VIPPGPLEEITTLASGQVELAALALVRVASMVVLLPVLGSVSSPATVRVGLAGALTICIFPTLQRTGVHLPESVFGFAGLALREMFVGLLAGWVFSLAFQVTEIAGGLIDMQAGFSMVELFDPTTGESTHLFGQWLGQMVSVLAHSFQAVPLGSAHLDAAKFAGEGIRITREAVLLGFQMAGPVLMALLMVNLVMAVVSRIMPQANAWILAMPLQILVACSVTALALPVVLGAFRGWQDEIWRSSETLFRSMR